MNIKSATKLGFIGTIVTIITCIIVLLLNTEVISLVNDDWDYDKREQVMTIFNATMNLCGIFSASSLATFFYVLYKNQK